jgi:prepilin-type processing-associated H-X9-DG protein
MLLPALGLARNTARTISCASNLKQWGMAHQFYQNDYDGYLIAAYWKTNVTEIWYVHLLGAYCGVKLGADAWGSPLDPSENGIKRCPNDMNFVKEMNTTRWEGVSYGYNYHNMSHIDNWAANTYIWRKASMIKNPTNLLRQSDSGHASERGGSVVSMLVLYEDATGNVYPRHSHGANILYVDGHVKETPNVGTINNDKTVWGSDYLYDNE